jgi:hypothetical protein
MDSLFTEMSGQRYHVLGIQIVDPDLIFRTKRVIQCCLGLLVVLLVRTIVLLMMGESAATTILSILFNMSIPAFGYLGARDGNATLMCIFVALMTLNAANAIAILFMVAYASITGLPQKGADGTTHPFQMTTSIWIQVILILAWAIMALVASFHANKLFNKLAQGDSIVAADGADTEVGLPQMDTKHDDNLDPTSFGLPASPGALNERDIDDEFHSSLRRKKVSASPREMRQLSPQE